jgi:hypothetical protein
MGIHGHAATLHAAVVVAAYLVALGAAARSTWSPCGLSMLSSITPLGERGRGRRFAATASWFVGGAALGGLLTGAGMAALAWAVASTGWSAGWLAGLAAAALAVAAAGDLGLLGFRIPLLRRQVNERWLDQYRPWVYGAGFGWQIGTGLTTYVMTMAVFATIIVAALTASPLLAASVGLVFGLARGAAVLVGAGITTPEALRRVHRRFDAWRRPVWLAVVVVQAVLGAALVTLLWAPSLIIVAAGAGVTTLVLTRTPLRRLATPG